MILTTLLIEEQKQRRCCITSVCAQNLQVDPHLWCKLIRSLYSIFTKTLVSSIKFRTTVTYRSNFFKQEDLFFFVQSRAGNTDITK